MLLSIEGTKSEEVKIEISEEQLIDKFLEYYREKYDIPLSGFTKDGNLYMYYENYTSHSWVEERVYRKALPTDNLYFELLTIL